MAKELTFTCYISIDGAEPVRWETLSEEEVQRVRRKMTERIGKSLSEYYSQHMEEYKNV